MSTLQERINEIQDKANKDTRELIEIETFRETLPIELRSFRIYRSDLYGSKYWLSYENYNDEPFEVIQSLAELIDTLPNDEIQVCRDGCVSFRNKTHLNALSDEKIMKFKREYVLPLVIKVNGAHFCKTYEFESFKIINGVSCRVSLKFNHRLSKLWVEKKFRSETCIDSNLRASNDIYHIFDNKDQSLGDIQTIRWGSTCEDTRSFGVYWAANVETFEGLSLAKLLEVCK